jgi:hypothetical protein
MRRHARTLTSEPPTSGLQDLSVAHTPRRWIPRVDMAVLDTRLWRTRAARGFSWHAQGAAGAQPFA